MATSFTLEQLIEKLVIENYLLFGICNLEFSFSFSSNSTLTDGVYLSSYCPDFTDQRNAIRNPTAMMKLHPINTAMIAI